MGMPENEVPRVTLDRVLEKFYSDNNLTERASYTKQDLGKALNAPISSSRLQMLIVAMVYYGILEKTMTKIAQTYKAEYRIGRLGVKCGKYTRDKLSDNLLRDMALSPKAFRELYRKFLGQSINDISNELFIEEYNLSDKSAEEAKKTFVKTMRTAKLINRDGILIDPDNLDKVNINSGTESALASDDPRKITFYLSGGEEISFPAKYSPRIWREGAAKLFEEMRQKDDL